MSIRDAKLKEFRIRKALLNPYEKEKLLENASD
jgi:N-acetylglutamate synthase-like GNAT family acetyltransferase